MRGRLLNGALLRRLGEAAGAGALAAQLEREEDWRPFLREAAEIEPDPAAALRTAIGRHRAARLGPLPSWFEPPARDLVEALLLPLDRECAVSVLRRMRAGAAAETTLAAVAPGALLRGARLEILCRSADPGIAVRTLGRTGVLERRTAEAVVRPLEGGAAWETVEQRLFEAFERERDVRARGHGEQGAWVRAMLADERTANTAVRAELSAHGLIAAADLERFVRLQQLDGLARQALRDPLGIGVVAGYAAAVEAQAIRLRAILAHVTAAWGRELLSGYLSGVAA